MKMFIPFAQTLEKLLKKIVTLDECHAKWLNTLSFLENCGARKIAACEHPTLVKEEMLKHAAEEFRHALHLKRQMEKVSPVRLETYSLSSMLGGTSTLHYLNALDLNASRYLKSLDMTKSTIKEGAYLMVTYAIERRAEELYPLYDKILLQANSRVRVKSILMEEKEHLQEMEKELEKFPSGFSHAEKVCAMESELCRSWLNKVAMDIPKQNRTYHDDA